MLQWEKTRSSSDSPAFKLKMSYFMRRYLLTIILSSMIFSGVKIWGQVFHRAFECTMKDLTLAPLKKHVESKCNE